ncbi:polysaccharide deacetylase family protein [Clostridium felsineum]|uniref:Uncharacterized protein n=1 Tax=Clostridium felsineum TaxID=36839 RepID=A0A1S8LQD9_9CLOT|nr:polysaccharide deacetylase family protein [Clostridium felsineum]URZ01073.1 hypothetical protein CLAUR_010610 [Clostridium felsineum]URZ06177.1 hypothetical protein CLROS_015100 [Clostridium felsineum]URZ11212.1 hypothetical protein CROST_019290 [Clostridium felsineum]
MKNGNRLKKKNIIIILGLVLISFGFFSAILLNNMHKNNLRKQEVEKQNEIAKRHKKEKKKLEEKKAKERKEETPGPFTPWTVKREDGKKIAYLTFDDGPSPNTAKIIDILNQNNIKATFFLIGSNAENFPDLVREEFKNGEVIGNHTYSHILSNKLNPEKFLEDLNKCDEVLKNILGKNYDSRLARFPGGSFGNNLNATREAVTKAGYRFVDWNDEIGDALGKNLPEAVLLSNLKKYTNYDTVVLLMHDTTPKTTTVAVLPQIIQYLRDRGYIFATL